MPIPISIPVTPRLDSVTNLLRVHQLREDPHRPAEPIHNPLRNVDTVSTGSIVWALIFIAASASLLGSAAVRAGRDRRDGLFKRRSGQCRAATPEAERILLPTGSPSPPPS